MIVYQKSKESNFIFMLSALSYIMKCEFQDSLKALKDKQQRTVYRLTLVKGWNTEDVDAYSSLFGIGNPDFVEIKGVTYCGT